MNERVLRLRRRFRKRWPAWKKKMREYRRLVFHKHIFLLFFASVLVGFGVLFILNIKFSQQVPKPKQKVALNVTKENTNSSNIFSFISSKKSCLSCGQQSTYDPYILSQKIKANDESITIIDIRSTEEFDNGHIKMAYNIPVYSSLKDVEGSERKESDIVNDFRKIKTPTIVVYGNSAYSTLPQITQQLLEKQGIRVAVLTIGWNEWYHMKNLWVPQEAWNSFNPQDYSLVQN